MALDFDPQKITTERVAECVRERFKHVPGLHDSVGAHMEQLGQAVQSIHAGIGGQEKGR